MKEPYISQTQNGQGSNLTSSNLTCPRCKSKNIALVDEKVTESFKTSDKLVIVKQLTNICKTCQRDFTRIVTQEIS